MEIIPLKSLQNYNCISSKKKNKFVKHFFFFFFFCVLKRKFDVFLFVLDYYWPELSNYTLKTNLKSETNKQPTNERFMITGVVVIRVITVVVMLHHIVVVHVIKMEVSRSGDFSSQHHFTNTLVFYQFFFCFMFFFLR